MGVYKGYQPNVFRAVSGSLFSTAGNWSRGYVPTGSDVADIRDNCTIDITRTLGTLVVRPGFTASINTGLTFQINDTIDVIGHLSCSGTSTINVLSNKNKINSLSPGSSTFNFVRSGNQNVPGVTYNNLTIVNQGIKTLIGNTTINGNLFVYNSTNISADNPTLEIGANSLFVSGTTTLRSVGNASGVTAYLKKNSPIGLVTFVGQLILNSYFGTIDFSVGNPNVELRGGINTSNWAGFIIPGTGTWTASTNNQQWDLGSDGRSIEFYNLIINNVVVRHYGGLGSSIIIKNSMNGTTPSSSFISGNNNANCNYWLQLDINITPMTTGSYDVSTYSDGGIIYNFPGSFTLPLSQYGNLYILNNGTKTLSANTTILNNLYIRATSTSDTILECSDKALTINGQTFVGTNSGNRIPNGLLKKNSPVGLVTFGGAFNLNNFSIYGGTIDFSVGNPNVEVKNGFNMFNQSGQLLAGTGQWKFSTNNQNLVISDSLTLTFYDVLISGPITLGGVGSVTTINFIFTNSFNGDNALSKFVVFSNFIVNYKGAPQPMATGILDTSTNLNTWIYGSGSQDIKGGTYRNLTLSGSGTKTLQGNVSVQNTYTLTAPATLNNNGFTLTNP